MNYSALSIIKTYNDYLGVYDSFSKLMLIESTDESGYTPAEYNDVLTDFCSKNGITKKEGIKLILAYLRKLQIFTLKIPFNPTTSFIEKIYLLLAQNISEHFLLKFENDISFLLGAQLEFKGKIYTYSIKNTLKYE